MLITIRTPFKDVVKALLLEQEILPLESKFRETGKHEPVIVEYPDDLNYRAISLWASDAIGCGLITGFDVER